MGESITDYSGEEGRDNEYRISCLCLEKEIHVLDYKKTQIGTHHIVLVPRQSTECDLFFAAWLPDDELDPDVQDQEILVDVGFPYEVFKRRVSLARKNHFYPQAHHIVVMDEGLATNLRNNALGQTVSIRVLPESVELKIVGL